MTALIEAALGRSRTVLSLLAMILVAGIIAFIDIPKEAEPDIPVPTIYVSMVYRGISPEDGERLLVRPMEREMRSVEGVKEIKGQSYPNGANVTLEFEAGFDVDKALQDVREAVDVAKAELPAAAEEPTVNEVNMSLLPILAVSLSGDVPERTLFTIAKRLKDKIEDVPSVLEADIAGDREEQMEVIIDPALLKSYGIDANEFTNFLKRNNTVVAAGELDTGTGRFAINVPGLIEGVEDVLELPVVVNRDASITVGDVAQGRRAFKDADGYARVNGQSSLTLEVSKRVGENILETVDIVRAIVEEDRKSWPPGIQVNYFQDKSKMIRDMLFELQNNVVTAVLLVMIVVVAALGLRTGLLVGIAIPGSFLMGILVLYTAGMTINMVVLFGLILSVGMLVDGAIVVTEYADRKMTEGMDRKEAYGLAAKRMAWPVTASTATTLAAFTPLLFWTGLFGEFMKYMPITLIATLSASLLMALIFVPTLGSRFGRPGIGNPEIMRAMAAGHGGDMTTLPGLTGAYARILKRALNNSGTVLLGALALLVSAQVLYWSFGKGVEFMPDSEPERGAVYVHARGNLSVDDKDRLTRQVEERIFDLPEFSTVYARSAAGARYRDGGSADIVGAVQFEYKNWENRRTSAEVVADMRERLADLAGVKVEIWEEKMGPPTGKQFHLNLMGQDFDVLAEHVAMVRAELSRLGGFVDIEDTLPLPGIEWELEVDRAQAAKFGVDIGGIGDMVQLVTEGLKLSDYRPDDADDEIDIVVRFPEEYRTLDELDEIRVTTPAGQVPISSFVKRVAKQDSGEINRIDSRRVISVIASVEDGILPDQRVRLVEQWLKENEAWNPEVRWEFKGEDEEQQESAAFLQRAFIVALFLMGVILVTQFNSFYSAFLILSAVIMSTIGVFLGLLVFQQPFGIIMSGVGVISLAGIVVNNNIVLIDTYDRLKKNYTDPVQAIMQTGVQRLRPVLLTTVTTVLGLMPMMFQINVDFVQRAVHIGAPSLQWWQQLSIAIVCGLTFATVLTLVVTPCALKLRTDVQAKLAHRRSQKAGLVNQPAE
ncbi:MAG: efflux RND transporter permease subunit [Rhodospirillaceae bacterium]|jgi:multidrug efflux pump|nr:efflux RND transporter permease subunit [Rhodospirillaceae bacterium]MBT5239255.1 efflux RND transporter permease subunit [Rhodospirillaceae bacterium]MBT5566141.1 efflux RND transporter permease subunit [Rhodospirillaceae bacterium]MBT6090602.1 efflux RND transporter permease subunit [Rhodospirillaceae bacterium]MBT6960366.1 efflux RND transporter permease subunit [Rhodospirillaceae bacterium]